MAPGLPDRVDYVRLAEEGARIERVYPLDAMPRLRDVLADTRGSAAASFEFATLSTGRSGATVSVKAAVSLTCQRCLQAFAFPVDARSEIEFADSEAVESQREVYAVSAGLVSLRELAEEELLLALPIVAMCSAPATCGQSPIAPEGGDAAAGEARDMPGDRSRPFAGLQEMLKKT